MKSRLRKRVFERITFLLKKERPKMKEMSLLKVFQT